jgi:hypothetical protein
LENVKSGQDLAARRAKRAGIGRALEPLMSHRCRMQDANEAFAMAQDHGQCMRVQLGCD